MAATGAGSLTPLRVRCLRQFRFFHEEQCVRSSDKSSRCSIGDLLCGASRWEQTTSLHTLDYFNTVLKGGCVPHRKQIVPTKVGSRVPTAPWEMLDSM
ncbi:hypothetical protein E2C01_094216 [Portunus trituberculatus]|uniref:Uncharacterized protein n=1 Tax=Portunus trituberculatus TaxID=210409 RepID=A0A5B7JL99_PORTR|nr:hypothetical protein [Portunus trituberculatus]